MPLDHSKAQLWVKRFDRFRQSGLTIAQFCRDEKVAVPSFNYWRKRIAPASTAPVPPSTMPRPNALNGDCLVQFTIEARGVRIECRSNSLQAIESVLTWATSQHDSGFQQLIVRD